MLSLASMVYLVFHFLTKKTMNFYVTVSSPMVVSYLTTLVFISYWGLDAHSFHIYFTFLLINVTVSGVLCYMLSIRCLAGGGSIYSTKVKPENLLAGAALGISVLFALTLLLSSDVARCESGRCKSAGQLLGTGLNFALLHSFSFFATFLNQVFVARLSAALLSKGNC